MRFHIKFFLLCVLVYCFLGTLNVFAGLVYQNFEPDNGTPPSPSAPPESAAEYGWGFNGAIVRLSKEGEPVHSGAYAWQVTIPMGPHVVAGTGIPSQSQTYDINFVAGCHNRLSFWVWSDPSNVGEHTVMIKFFDHGKYHDDGIGIWTNKRAAYKQWSELDILFSQLPSDFDLGHVDKIEFFHYWAGTYYLDDIEIKPPPGSQNDDHQCSNQESSKNYSPLDINKELEVEYLRERNLHRLFILSIVSKDF